MEELVKIDQELFLFLNNLGDPAWDDFWNIITNKFASIPLYGVLLYFLFRTIGLKQTLVSLVLVALLITCTDQLANVFKHAFERPRPCRQEGIMELARFVAVRCGRFGFFSAHAASSAALTVFLGMILKRFWKPSLILLSIWAGLVSYSRIYVGVHYPGDILVGWVFGILLGFLWYLLWKYLLKKYFFNPSSPAHKTS